MPGERVKCPYCDEWVTLPRRPRALFDPAAARHMKRCPFNPLRLDPPAPLPSEAPDADE